MLYIYRMMCAHLIETNSLQKKLEECQFLISQLLVFDVQQHLYNFFSWHFQLSESFFICDKFKLIMRTGTYVTKINDRTKWEYTAIFLQISKYSYLLRAHRPERSTFLISFLSMWSKQWMTQPAVFSIRCTHTFFCWTKNNHISKNFSRLSKNKQRTKVSCQIVKKLSQTCVHLNHP